MRRWLGAVLASALLGLAGGCADEPSEPTAAAASPAPTATPDASEAPKRTTSADPARPAAGDAEDGSEVASTAQAPVRTQRRNARVEVVARGLEVPWDVAFLPDGRALVTERPGRIRLIERSGRLRSAPVARIPVQAVGEGGLMGLDLDPGWADGNRFAYTMVTRGGQVRVLRLRWTGSRLVQDGTVLDGIEAGTIHDSGRLRFGPDRRLYVVTGDAGERGLSQLRSSLNGKVLALRPSQYRNSTNRPTVVSVGHRNPQGLDWRPGTRRLFVTEHGPSGFDGPSCCDELNAVSSGGNYAWPRYGTNQPASARPAFQWQGTIAPSGVAFVSRSGSSWTGDLLVAALRGRALHRLDFAGGRVRRDQILLSGRYGRLRAVVEAPDGSMWVTTSNLDTYGRRTSADDDRILRVIPPRG